MKNIIIIISIVCFLGITTLSHAVEILRVPLTQNEQAAFFENEEATVKSIDSNMITAGADDPMFTVLAVIGLLVVIAAALAPDDTTTTSN